MITRVHTIATIGALFIGASAAVQAQTVPDTQGAKFPWPETGPAASQPTTAPAAEVRGSIAVRAVQGTQGGQPIGKVPVEIDLLHRGVLVDTIRTHTDEHGVVMVEDLPITIGVQPVVRVLYADLTYQVQAPPLDATNPQQQIDVVCYDPTEQPPPWRVLMRHVMVARAPGGLEVTEVMVLNNPDARTWIGVPIGGTKRVTTAFQLPHDARDIKLGGGFHDWCCTSFAQGRLINHLPLMPEKTQMTYSYFIPASGGRAELELTAPAPVDHVMLLVPDSLVAESLSGLEAGASQNTGTGSVRSYMAANQTSGNQARVVLAGLTDVAAAPASAAPTGSARSVKIFAAVGGAILILAAAAILLMRGRKSVPSATV